MAEKIKAGVTYASTRDEFLELFDPELKKIRKAAEQLAADMADAVQQTGFGWHKMRGDKEFSKKVAFRASEFLGKSYVVRIDDPIEGFITCELLKEE